MMLVKTVGEIPNRFVSEVTNEINMFYERVRRAPQALLVYIFMERGDAERFYLSEAIKYGVAVNVEEPLFLGFHEAWSGVPRIGIIYGELSHMEQILRRGIVIHEAAHAILHGSLGHYILPPIKVDKLRSLGFNGDEALGLINILYTSVKDFEVSALMTKHGYDEEVKRYVLSLIKPSKEQVEEWNRFRGSKLLEVMHLTARLKEVLPTALLDTKIIARKLDYLDKPALDFLLDIVLKSKRLITSNDTFRNFQIFYGAYINGIYKYLEKDVTTKE